MAMHFHLVGLNCRYSHSCLALYYVRHALECHLPGCRIDINQFTINDPYYDLLLKLSSSGADALFFSVYVWNHQYIQRLVDDLAAVNPERPIILGGPQAASLENIPPVCTVVEGEVEGVDKQFYLDLENKNLQPHYPCKSGMDFPFPYRDEDFAAGLKNRQVYYESSRGCPFRCSYCLSSIGLKVGRKAVDVVRQELDVILAHEPKIIKFVDRTFNDNPDRALQIWHHLADQPGRTMYHLEIAPDRFTEEMFDFLESIGPDRFQFEIGIQSTNPETLLAINRNMDVDVAAKNIRRLVGMDSIHLHVDLILGLPFDTRETFRESFNRVFGLEPHYIQMGLLKVLPDTPIRHQTDEYGLVYCKQPPYQILANRWLDHQQMSRLYLFCECVESFYNNRYFRTFWKYLRMQDENPFSFFEELLTVSEQRQFFDLSHTQELLARMLDIIAAKRVDRELVRDILRYDWLRCGHRFLPSFIEDRPLTEVRTAMRKALPPSLPGVYEAKGRNEFIKRGMFLELSAETLEVVGLGKNENKPKIICFLPEQTTGVIKHNKVVCLEGIA